MDNSDNNPFKTLELLDELETICAGRSDEYGKHVSDILQIINDYGGYYADIEPEDVNHRLLSSLLFIMRGDDEN